MEGSVCDEDVLVPLRKRLLVEFKKQNSGSDQSCGSTSASSPQNGNEADASVKNLMDSLLSASSGYSLEEIVERSNETAVAKVKAAEAARILAEEKAVVAAKAITAAKTALDLVADFYEETSGRHCHLKKNKSKKEGVHSLYNNHVEDENDLTDKEDGISKPVIKKPKAPNKTFERDSHAIFSDDATLDTYGSSYEVSRLEKDTNSSHTKSISTSWKIDKKDIITQKRKARNQPIRMVETQVELS